MADKFELLEQRIAQVIAKLEELRADNDRLRETNTGLESQLTEIKHQFKSLQLSQHDQSELIKSRLASVLSRIEELEKIGL